MLTVSDISPAPDSTAARSAIIGCRVSGPGNDVRVRWRGADLYLGRFDGAFVSAGKVVPAGFRSFHWDSFSVGATPSGWSLAFGGTAPTVFEDGLQKGLSWAGSGGTAIKVFVNDSLTRDDAELVVPIVFKAGSGSCGVVLRHSAAGGYAAVLERGSSNYIKLYLYNGSGVLTQLSSAGISLSDNKLYVLRVRVFGQYLQARVWDASTSEGSTWQVSASDTTFSSGQVGLGIVGASTFTPRFLPLAVDGFSSVGKVYFWADVSAASVYSDSAAVPGDGAQGLSATRDFVSFVSLDSWGSLSPLFTDGESLSGVRVGVQFSVTSCSEFILDFAPVIPQHLEISVNSVRVGNAFLSVAGGWQIAGNTLVPFRTSVAVTVLGPGMFRPVGSVLISVLWRGQTVASWTVVLTEDFSGRAGWGSVGFVASPVPESWHGRFGFGYTSFGVFALPPNGSFTSSFGVVSAVASFAFSYYFVSHVVKRDLVVSAVCGEPSFSDAPASCIVEAWTRAFFGGSFLVQGPVPGEFVMSLVLARLQEAGAPASFIVASPVKDLIGVCGWTVWKPEAKVSLVVRRAEAWEPIQDD